MEHSGATALENSCANALRQMLTAWPGGVCLLSPLTDHVLASLRRGMDPSYQSYLKQPSFCLFFAFSFLFFFFQLPILKSVLALLSIWNCSSSEGIWAAGLSFLEQFGPLSTQKVVSTTHSWDDSENKKMLPLFPLGHCRLQSSFLRTISLENCFLLKELQGKRAGWTRSSLSKTSWTLERVL